MYIPDSILKNIEKKPTDNDYIYTAEDMYKDIMSKNEDTYKNFHMAVLANALELYYKGVLEASGLNVDRMLIEESHNLYRLYSEISTRIQPLTNESTMGEKRELREYLRNLSTLYIDARYHNAQTSYEDFDKCRQFLDNQRSRCMSLLDPSMEWNKPRIKPEPNNLPISSYEPSKEAETLYNIDNI